uniref:Putative Erf family protein n=1 Tax=viral metagenome TaxID=1070528 RepID=A0A6M3KSV1_9ZZZZ
MIKSETIGELAKALCIVQGKLTGAKKDSINPFYKSKYSDLASVWDACRGLLSENGLSVVQTSSPSGENTTIIDTTMIHNSGEWISGSMQVPLVKNDPQGVGSAMTYARRYGLSAIVGVCPEDDDAESATKREPDKQVSTSSAPEATTDKSHWCKEHNTTFFMKGKMKSYAHPIEGSEDADGKKIWCHEHTPEGWQPETIPGAPKSTPEPPKPKTDSPVLKPMETLQDYCTKLGWGKVAWQEYLWINFKATKLGDLTDEQVIKAAADLKAMVMVNEAGGEAEVESPSGVGE